MKRGVNTTSCKSFATRIHHVEFCDSVRLIQKGQISEAVALGKAALTAWEGAGCGIDVPRFKSVLAEGIAQLGDFDAALDLINEAIAQIERPGWEERNEYAETLRIKGCMLARKGDPEEAERAYIDSLDWARAQQAKSWELRTATSYARLMRDQGRVGEARELLAPIYAWFTEGFGSKDLKEAKALLEELADAPALVEPVAPAS
jgi:predicted ATPase